jgi:hypothetical protein
MNLEANTVIEVYKQKINQLINENVLLESMIIELKNKLEAKESKKHEAPEEPSA